MADEPVLLAGGTKLLLFGPTIVNAEIARILLSKLSREGVSFERRGRKFETEMTRRFAGWGFHPASFSIRSGGQEYEFDLLVPWDEYLFVFECKSRSALGIDPARAWQARQHMLEACAQVARLARFLETDQGRIADRIAPAHSSLTVVPCVLNALPLQVRGKIEGVYVTDLAAVTTFFELGEVGAYATHRIPGLPPVRERLHAERLWAGPSPSPADFLRFLDEAPTLKIVEAHLETTTTEIRVDETHRIETVEFGRLPDSAARVIDTLGADGEAALRNSMATSQALHRAAAGDRDD